jgi:hypothetical protein
MFLCEQLLGHSITGIFIANSRKCILEAFQQQDEVGTAADDLPLVSFKHHPKHHLCLMTYTGKCQSVPTYVEQTVNIIPFLFCYEKLS